MDCNKDEAVRAKEIAESKFTERKYAVAKKFALKAQNLYPGLEGLSQMMTTLDVYISAEDKICGEVDWYGILGVNPLADDETIKKQYRKLALILHPDKNKTLGADGAFKLVSEAWSLLSDKSKRLAYNQRRNVKGFQPKVPNQTAGPSGPRCANGSQKFTNSATSNARTQHSNARTGTTSFPPVKKADTFWTVCNRCKTHYEYLRIYLNHTLLCPNCHEAFMALEKAPPPNVFKSSNWSSRQQHQSSRHHSGSSSVFSSGRNFSGAQNSEPSGLNSFDKTNSQWGPFSRTTGVGSTVASASAAAQAANVVQQASEKVKREREDRQSVAEWERSHLSRGMGNPSFKVDKSFKKRKLDDNNLNGYGRMTNQRTMANGGGGVQGVSETRKVNAEIDKIFGFSGTCIKPNSMRELSFTETRNMLIEKAKTGIRRMLEEWRSKTEANSTKKERVKEKGKGNKKQKSMVDGNAHNLRCESDGTDKKLVDGSSADDTENETSTLSINVPDPDFHNFDMDRTESSFGDDQVWAAYDDDDGMPRYYARVHKVISLKPFKMRISWLNSRSNSELGPIDWIGLGFTKTCGEFRTGRHEISDSLNSFSHKVSWTKGTRGVVQIYPKKGEIWAVYKNWSPEWDEHTPDEVIHKYEMVEVLDDFGEEQGVTAAFLIKVTGFKAVFCMPVDSREVRRIPRDEMFRFSHQVPYHLLTGEEARNAPKGCRELDPAATPVELLEVITEAQEAPVSENGGKERDEMLQQSVDKGLVNEAIEAASKASEGKFMASSEQAKG